MKLAREIAKYIDDRQGPEGCMGANELEFIIAERLEPVLDAQKTVRDAVLAVAMLAEALAKALVPLYEEET
jgi:hypothetical protein